jgi:hypothetical protein
MNSYAEHYKAFIRRIGIAFVSFTLSRLLFFLFNYTKFQDAGLYEFLVGLRFDALSISWAFLPFIVFSILPIPYREKPLYQSVLKFLFHLSNTICIIFNLIDVEFFKIINNRSTASLFDMVTEEGNFFSMAINYSIDFWYLWFIVSFVVFISVKSYDVSAPKPEPIKKPITYYSLQFSQFIIIVALLILGLRGGTQPIPISIVDAGDMVDVKMAPLVLNTPFTILKTFEIPGVPEVKYMEEEDAKNLISLIHQPHLDNKKWNKPNIVLIILESFSKEYIGYYNDGEGYTPFLDSLLNESMTFDNSFANGMRSIDGIPAITASIPLLMPSAIIRSPYAANQFNSLANTLGAFGYQTSFYHGGTDGTMGFDHYTKVAGFDVSNEMSTYPNYTEAFDGAWGIPDHLYLDYFADELNQTKNPFFSTVFTLSSHHPYKIPKQFTGKFKTGSHPILEAVSYTDYSLKLFFNKIAKQDWYNNTLFVITADHTSYKLNKKYDNSIGALKVPIAFFKPSDTTMRGKHQEVFQHIDIMPTVLEWVGYDQPYFSFGSPLSDSTNRRAVYGQNSLQLIKDDYLLLFNGKESRGFYNYKTDPDLKSNLSDTSNKKQKEMVKELKAFKQLYNNRIIYNKMKPIQ